MSETVATLDNSADAVDDFPLDVAASAPPISAETPGTASVPADGSAPVASPAPSGTAEPTPTATPGLRDRVAALAAEDRRIREEKASLEPLRALQAALATKDDNPLAVLEALGMDLDALIAAAAGFKRERTPEEVTAAELAAIKAKLAERDTTEAAAATARAEAEGAATVEKFITDAEHTAKAEAARFPCVAAMGREAAEEVVDLMALANQAQTPLTWAQAFQQVETGLQAKRDRLAATLTTTANAPAVSRPATSLNNSMGSTVPASAAKSIRSDWEIAEDFPALT